ncbi:hypothetical protein QQS21_012473 [Conoideocrella luteorostrata]|uniref:Fucose-specific lectin n=1 Tax=Conoideocrella luteorostrata TaxID=1105319 RepID=A0AAJ0CFM9_9HYPO|nr:hypothetical protein QQS21_012473 [Conoideocrella luteorostrata]
MLGPDGLPDSINEPRYSFRLEQGAALAAYWPAIIYYSSGINAVWFGPNNDTYGYNTTAEPLSRDSVSDLKLVYRRDDGLLYEYDRSGGVASKNDSKTNFLATQSTKRGWDSDFLLTLGLTEIKGFEIAPNGTLAVFATARDGSSDLFNTYLLYQAADGKIMYGTNTNSSGWVGPSTDAVFDGADVPTNLACVTMAPDYESKLQLLSATDQNKCYFQRKGELVEVAYSGGSWSELGTVATS